MAYTLNLGTLLINLRANTAHYNSALRVAERNLDVFSRRIKDVNLLVHYIEIPVRIKSTKPSLL